MTGTLEQRLSGRVTVSKVIILYNELAQRHNALIEILRASGDGNSARELARTTDFAPVFTENGTHARDDAYFANVNETRPEQHYDKNAIRGIRATIRKIYEGTPLGRATSSEGPITDPAEIQRRLKKDYSISFIEGVIATYRKPYRPETDASATPPSHENSLHLNPFLEQTSPLLESPDTSSEEQHARRYGEVPSNGSFNPRKYLTSLKGQKSSERVTIPDSGLEFCVSAFNGEGTNARDAFVGRMWKKPTNYVSDFFAGRGEVTKAEIGDLLHYILDVQRTS